jgi:hypothetical protein
LRTIAAVLDGVQPAALAVSFSGSTAFDCYTFRRGENEAMAAVWMPGRTKEGLVEAECDVTFPAIKAQRAWAIDTLNGTEQELNVTSAGGGCVLRGILIKDYPVFLRLVFATETRRN